MRTVLFNDQDSYSVYNLLTKSVNISTPKAKTSKISIEGRDGQIDTSEAVAGRICYDNRLLTFRFRAVGDGAGEAINTFINTVHGKKIQVQMDDQSDSYYKGRCAVNIDDDKGYYIDITCEVDAEPYAWSAEESEQTLTAGDNTVTVNGTAPVTPTFHATEATTVTYDGMIFNLTAGEHTLGSIVILGQGIITADKPIRITWKEGSL